MKVTETTFTDKGREEYDYCEYLRIDVDGKQELEFMDGEPEDANLRRDFNDCFSIVNLMRRAYEAGRAGEEFEYEIRQVDDL